MNLIPTNPETLRLLNGYLPSALCCRNTLYATYCLTRDVLARKIPGCLVECGVYAGAQLAAMSLATHDYGERLIHGFDSFEGIPLGGPHDASDITDLVGKDPTPKADAPFSSGKSACSIEKCQENLERWGVQGGPPFAPKIHLHKGWFQHTLPPIAPSLGPIALLRLDGDLYDSTLVCLQHLYPLVSPGGIIIIDDYNLTGCRQAFRDYFDSFAKPPPTLTTIPQQPGDPTGPVYFLKA